MALGRAFSVAVRGLDGEIVEIEADITSGLPGVHLVGLPDAALQESRDRVRAAVTNCGNSWPMARLTLALSPATLPKMGSVYDIALAAAVLSAQQKKPWERLENTLLLGELSLDGRVRPVRGVLPAVLAAKRDGWPAVVVPADNLPEASLVDGIDVRGVRTLGQLQSWLRGSTGLAGRITTADTTPESAADLADVVGQSQARFAVEVAAAGAHHLMLTGPPGVGKTMLAQRLPGLLPSLSGSESLEVTAIHSVAGLLSGDTPLITRPPFVAPHHSSSVAALVGGGSGMARPGAVSRAHRGVLFLDECAEISLSALEALRTPLEDGEIRLARRDGVACYPARFQLVLAANPCPCAPADPQDCICAAATKRRYLGKLSGPLLDRVDLRVQMHRLRAGAFLGRGRRVDVAGSPAGGAGPGGGRATMAATWVPDQRRSQRAAVAPQVSAQQRRDAPVAHRAGPRATQHPRCGSHLAGGLEFGRLGRSHIARHRRGRRRPELPANRSTTMIDPTARAWAYLSRVAEPPCAQLAALVRCVGPVEAADRVRRGQVGNELAQHTGARREIDRAADDLELLMRRGGRLITPDDDEWPVLAFAAFSGAGARARPCGHSPLVLWALGPARLDEVAPRAAAVVGTRAATAYGEHVAADLAAGLAERDVAVVSGGAYGIDGAAHRAALDSEGITVAVLAGGFDIPYPAGHSALLHRIAQHGVLFTEYPPGVRPARHRFLTRNRLVAAVARAAVVVEAGLRSGAANTAAWARALGRVVAAVPGPVTSSASAGCHTLLRHGAELVTRADDIVEFVGHIGELAGDEPRPGAALDVLSEAERQVYEALPGRGAATIDEIAVGSGLLPAQVLGPLAILEVAGLAECRDGRWRILRAGAGQAAAKGAAARLV